MTTYEMLSRLLLSLVVIILLIDIRRLSKRVTALETAPVTRRSEPAQNLPDALELARLHQQAAAAARLAAELQRIINSPQAACLPLETIGSARHALAGWEKTMKESQK